jgi:hypothetical protein
MGASREHFEILNAAAANVIPNKYPTGRASKAIFAITITGTITVTLYLDVLGDGSRIITLGAYTASTVKQLVDPVGSVQAVSSGAAPASAAIVDMFLVN